METDKYIRCEKTTALLSVDNDGLKAYKAQRKARQKVSEYGTEINKLKTEMMDIKNVLHEILNRLD